MEISWKWLNLCLGLLFFQLCNGFPINLEDSVADQHTQLLTGLVAVLLTVCSVVLLAGCLCCQRRNGFKEFRDSPVVASAASNLDHGHVNPIANGEFTIFTPLSTSPYNNNVFLANERIITRTAEDFVYEDFDVSSWFNESEKDFPRIKLKYIKELGKGWFGKVVEGAAREVPPNEQSWTPVVVRILEASASRKERVLFLNDAAIYRCGTHANILSLIGRCLDTVPLLLLQEYCPQGDLKNYLRSKKENVEQLLSTDYPLLWCCQLTSGLKHLHSNGVTHPDLATRNCQLASDLTLKIGDYGLSENKYPEDYYQGSPRVPVRWCSPESLTCTPTTIQPKKSTTESNIWSLGVTMWEICECGGQPYSTLSDDEVISQVFGPPNVRLSRPSFPVLYTDYLYRLMQLCWTNPESRPTVSQINLMLSDLWQVYKNTKSSTLSVDDFEKRWESFRPNSAVKPEELEDSEIICTKPLSPSLNNLHGSLDNLLDSGDQMELWLENVTKMDDSTLARSNSNVILSFEDPVISEMSSSESSDRPSPKQKKSKLKSKIDFDLNAKFRDIKQPYNFSDSALFSQRTSSESETEDENWRKKVERGAYTEKVRLKSRSVADLMILTHVDYSESESETPLPSLDYRVNYKNVRYAPKNNLEPVTLTYGSEGNLLSVHDTFQEELKKLKEERRDSLLFVPDNHSQTSFSRLDSSNHNFSVEELTLSDSNLNNTGTIDSTSKRLMHELNRVAEIQPANQVFNVFSVTIDKFKPIRVNSCKLNDIINFSDIEPSIAPEQSDKWSGGKENVEESLNQGNNDHSERHISDFITETYPAFDGDFQSQLHGSDSYQLSKNIDSFGLKDATTEIPSPESHAKDTINPIFFNDALISELETEFSSSNTENNSEASTPGTVVHCRISVDGISKTDHPDLKQNLDNDLQPIVLSGSQACEINSNSEEDNHEIAQSEVPTDESMNEKLIQEPRSTFWVPKLSEIINQKIVNNDPNENLILEAVGSEDVNDEDEVLLRISEVPKLSEMITNQTFIENEVLVDENSCQASLPEPVSHIINLNLQENTRPSKVIFMEINGQNDLEMPNKSTESPNFKLDDDLQPFITSGLKDGEISSNLEKDDYETVPTSEIPKEKLIQEDFSTFLVPKLSEIIKNKEIANEGPNENLIFETSGLDTLVSNSSLEEALGKSEVPKLSEIISNKIFIENEILINQNSYPASFSEPGSRIANLNLHKNTRPSSEVIFMEINVQNALQLPNKSTESPNFKLDDDLQPIVISGLKDAEINPNLEKDEHEEVPASENTNEKLIQEAPGTFLVPKLSEIIKNKEIVIGGPNENLIFETSGLGTNEESLESEVPKLSEIISSKIFIENEILINQNSCPASFSEPSSHISNLNIQKNAQANDLEMADNIHLTENLNSKMYDQLQNSDTIKLNEIDEKDENKTSDVNNDFGISGDESLCEAKNNILVSKLSEIIYSQDQLQNNHTMKLNEINETYENKTSDDDFGVSLNHSSLCEAKNDVIIPKLSEIIHNKGFIFNERSLLETNTQLPDVKLDQNTEFHASPKVNDNKSDVNVQNDLFRTNDEPHPQLENTNIIDLNDIILDINKTSNIEDQPNECEELHFTAIVQVPKLSEVVKSKINSVRSIDRSSTYQVNSHDESTAKMDNYLPDLKHEANPEHFADQNIPKDATIDNSKKSLNNNLHKNSIDVNDILVDKVSEKESNLQGSIINEPNNLTNGFNLVESSSSELQDDKRVVDVNNIIPVDLNEASELNNLKNEFSHCEPNESSMTESSQENIQKIVDFDGIVPIDVIEAPQDKNSSILIVVDDSNSIEKSSCELLERSGNENIIDLDEVILEDISKTVEIVKNEVPKLSEIILNEQDICEPLVKDSDLTTPELSEDALNKNIVTECLKNDTTEELLDVGNGPTEQNESHVCDKKYVFESKRNHTQNISPATPNESSEEEQTLPNGSSCLNVFTSTPAHPIRDYVAPKNLHSNLNLFDTPAEKEDDFHSDLAPLDTSKGLNYSLETWDNFLGKTLDAQKDIQNENLFDSFSSEPHSLLFVENGTDLVQPHEYAGIKSSSYVVPSNEQNISNINNGTFVIEPKNENTFTLADNEINNETYPLTKSESVESETEDAADNSAWSNGGGWFLHPQISNKEPSGTIEVRENTGSYVGFGIDDEIMAAIRNELLNKLPHAQVAPSEKVTEVEEWDSGEKNEVFLKYNIYNPPLSPIIEESYIEESEIISPRQDSDNEDSEWSEHDIPETLPPEVESQSAHTYDSQMKGPHHRHTPSQDSCCSNDTLFNLEELTCAVGDVEKENDLIKNITEPETVVECKPENNESNEVTLEEKCIDADEKIQNIHNETNNNIDDNNLDKTVHLEDTSSKVEEIEDIKEKDDVEENTNSNVDDDQESSISGVKNSEDTDYIKQFISQEIEHSSVQFSKLSEGSSSEPNSSTEENPIVFKKTQVAPLPSPEDNPWKQLPASLLSYDKVISQNNTLLLPATESNDVVPEFNDLPKDKGVAESQCENVGESETKLEGDSDIHKNCDGKDIQPFYENIEPEQPDYEHIKSKEPFYENVKDAPPVYENVKDPQPVYQNFNVSNDIYNEVDYVNIVNLENSKNNSEYLNEKKDCDQDENKLISETSQDEDIIYGMLTDIKFNGPSENQLISTSFSESNDINDEQDWDSGSDTRSSSSGEFIWKEGEHEESLKALRAAPQDVLEDIKPMEEITEESTDESDVSSGSSDEEGEAPEFVPSAWDKFATPTKSALRSPEKTLEKSMKNKSKGVWFKKQKYHCVYEYPREPESPVLQSQDLWKPQLDYSSFTDWEFDADTAYFPPTADDSDIFPSAYNYQPKSISSRNLYHLTSISDFVPSNAGLEDEFFVSSTARPFDVVGNLSSQFFPGSSSWNGENATPDSGVEDSTPGSSTEMSECDGNVKTTGSGSVPSLKKLASEAVKRSKQMSIKSNDALGGLRHTRNKLKLDLPPSPSAFTSTKMFTVEPTLEPVIREKPTFTTFGKSRFSVQHVDTPTDESKNKNVSFEALPYKPMKDEPTQIDSQKEFCPDIDHEEKHILRDKFDCGKGHSEFIRGEASLLDSADEDSGIESSTLERKTSNYDLLQ